jgi:hypothetical protein
MIIQSIPLCSRCAMHEISSWLWENSSRISPELMSQISIELRAIRLKGGECLVCGNNKVAEDCIENILRILGKNKNNLEVKEEFERLFAMIS